MRMLLPIPPSVNAMYRNVAGRGRVKTGVYLEWLSDADSFYFQQKRGIKPVEGKYRLRVSVPLTLGGDIDNRLKAVSDYLVSRKLTPDDKHCQSFTIERAEITDCEVEVTPA